VEQREAGEEREGEPRVLDREQGLDAAPGGQLAPGVAPATRAQQDGLGDERRPRPGGEGAQVRQPERGFRR
jgi:hypothetical protein